MKVLRSAPTRLVVFGSSISLALLVGSATRALVIVQGPKTPAVTVTAAAPNIDTLGSSAYNLNLDTDSQLNSDLNAVVATGVTMLRIDVHWSSVEQVQGTFQWGEFDRIVNGAIRHNLQPLLLINDVPAWARASGTTQVNPPRDDSLIVPFVKQAVSRYAALGVRYWEVFNEVNGNRYWEPAPSASQYVALLRTVYTAIKQTDRNSVVLSAGLAPEGDASDGSAISPETFLKGMYAAGAKGYFDAVAIHAYTFPQTPTSGTPYNNLLMGRTLLRATMDANGDTGKLIWATESGYSTCVVGPGCVSEANQAAYVAQAIQIWRQDPGYGPFFVYGLRDPALDTGKESRFGYIRNNGSHKPLFEVLEAAAAATS